MHNTGEKARWNVQYCNIAQIFWKPFFESMNEKSNPNKKALNMGPPYLP